MYHAGVFENTQLLGHNFKVTSAANLIHAFRPKHEKKTNLFFYKTVVSRGSGAHGRT